MCKLKVSQTSLIIVMQIPKQSHKKTLVIILATVGVLAATALAAYAFNVWPFEKNGRDRTSSYTDTPTPAEAPEANPSVKTTDSGTKTQPGSTPVPEPTPSSDGGKSTIPMSITSAQVSGSKVMVRTLIETIDSSGSCTLTATNQGKTYSTSVGVQAGPASSTCKGFDVDKSALSSGTWNITVTFNTESLTASDSTKVVVP